jgi:Uroporphyrinogen decarboxylase (URO-D)
MTTPQTSQQRFLQTMLFGAPDRIPCFDEGMREETLEIWRTQGLPAGVDLSSLISIDRREEIEPDMRPLPELSIWPASRVGLDELRQRLDPDDPDRLPEDWVDRLHAWKERNHVLMLRVHRGFFLSMGVNGWERFYQVMALVMDDPAYVHELLAIQGEFAARLIEKILKHVRIDAAIFSEPIGGNHGPLISPRMYEEFMLPHLEPIREVLENYGVEYIIERTYANTRILLPCLVGSGITCLWACETDAQAMDFHSIRHEFGKQLRLIGGIDLDILRQGKEAIRQEFDEKVIPLIAEGGYIPLVDGRVREDISFENYLYYRKLLEQAALKQST